MGASHSFPAAEQRVQAGQHVETAEAFSAGTVLSKAGDSKHQSNSQSKACFGSSVVKVGNVNVRTLAGKEAHAGKAEFLAEELSRLSIALCGLCEVRWPGQGQKQVGAYSVHYSGGITRGIMVWPLRYPKQPPSACKDVHLSVIVSSQPPFTLHSPPTLSFKCMPQQTAQVLMSRILVINSSSSNLRRCQMQTCCCLWATLAVPAASPHDPSYFLLLSRRV